MRRIQIALLTLPALILSGWVLFELGWLGETRSGPPRGEDAARGVGDRSSEVVHGVGSTLTEDASSAREPVRPDHGHRPTGTLLVRVVDRASGKVVDGAAISIDPSGPAGPRDDPEDRSGLLRNPPDDPDALTDEQGEARIEVSSGIRMRMRVRDRGPEVGRSDRSIAPLAPGERREVLVDLPRGLDLEHWVLVVSESGQKPVAGASVRLIFAGAPFPRTANAASDAADAQVSTDSEGLARLRVPSWRTALARIDASGYGSLIASVVPGHATPASAQVLRLSRSATLTANVTLSPGVPLADASVVLTLPAPELAVPRGTTVLAGDLVWSARTDEQGRSRIDDLPAEVPIRVEIQRGTGLVHRVADPWVFSPGEEAERSVCVGGAARLLGMLLGPDSRPMADVEIWLARVPASPEAAASDPASIESSSRDRYFWSGTLERPFAKTRTDGAGSFSFDGLEIGDWWVGPAPARTTDDDPARDPIAPRAEHVRVLSGATEVEVVLHASRGRWIRGRVVDPEDVAVAQTVVDARAVDALGTPSTRTTPSGSFALGPLAEGRFLVRARGRWGWTDSPEVAVRAGDDDVLLRLCPGATLRGRAIDRETGAACVAMLHLRRSGDSDHLDPSGEEPRAAIASAGRDGSFEFHGLVPGTYELTGRSDDGRMGFQRDVVVRLGESAPATVLSMAPAAKLRIRWGGKAAGGRFVVLCEGRTLAEGSSKAGTSTLVTVPAGVVTVRFTANGQAAEEREVRAQATGEETEVVFSSD